VPCGRAAFARGRRRVDFIVPIHSIYSNVAAHLTAPLGTSVAVKDRTATSVRSGPPRELGLAPL